MEPVYLEIWSQALDSIQQHMVMHTKHSGLTFVGELPQGIGGPQLPKMDHLVCFLPGAIALGLTGGHSEASVRKKYGWSAKDEEQMNLAKELMKTCWGMYKVTKTKLAPEITWFHVKPPSGKPPVFIGSVTSPDLDDRDSAAWRKDYIVKRPDAHNLQRPETVESLFIMWRITGDPTYREWGWKIFQAFREHAIVKDGGGFTSLDNANEVPPGRRDEMESFWMVSLICIVI